MVARYTSGGLAKVVAKLQSVVGPSRDLVAGGVPDVGNIVSTATDMVSICKALDGLGDELRALAKDLRRQSRIILTLHDLGKSTGKSADPAAFFAACSAVDLDYLVALRQANNAPGWLAEFYLRCRDQVIFDNEEPDGGSDTPGTSGHLDPQGPVDYR
jgi:hypothetical protein